jgi:hypothetical protein
MNIPETGRLIGLFQEAGLMDRMPSRAIRRVSIAPHTNDSGAKTSMIAIDR